jgi:flagellar biosynthesis/type III secretory pathway chaperone
MNKQMTIESLADRLLETLDREAAHLRIITDHLASLSRLVLKRDEAALYGLLEEVREEAANRSRSENARGELTTALAAAIGCRPSEITLSMLEKHVSRQQEQQLRKRGANLRLLVADLQKQHYSTSMLLCEMIRINRTLLAGITGSSNGVTYGRGGQAKWSGSDNILSVRY